MKSVFWLVAVAGLPACLQEPEAELDGEGGEASAADEQTNVVASEIGSGVFDVGVIPDLGVGCPAGSNEVVIRMDDEDSNNGSSRSGFVGKTNFQETTSATRLYFCKVEGSAFMPFSTSDNASDQRDDYAVLKLGTSCPAGSQEFWRAFDNEDSNNGNFSTGNVSPNIVNWNTRLYFCLFRYAAPGVGTQAGFPSFGTGFRYGVFAPSDFNRGALGFGTIRTDDEDSGNANGYSAPSDALLAAQRIIQPDRSVSTGATFLRTVRAQ